jgi:hypothetical protein
VYALSIEIAFVLFFRMRQLLGNHSVLLTAVCKQGLHFCCDLILSNRSQGSTLSECQECQIIVKYICLWDLQSVGTHWMLARCCEIQAIEKAMRVQSMVRFFALVSGRASRWYTLSRPFSLILHMYLSQGSI